MSSHGYKYNDLGKTAKGAYDAGVKAGVGGEAGAWYFYMLKNMIDVNGDGRVTPSRTR